MAGFSKNELINWLKEGPKTDGWGAILAFNRSDTNTLLLQEYIQRFSTDTYLAPVEGFIYDNNTLGQYITDYTLDFPRLSFEISNVEEDTADAKLTMRVVGGTHVSFKDAPGGRREAVRIQVVDPLNGPALTLDLRLVDVPTEVNAGRVVMDLSSSSNFSLDYSDHLHEQRLAGTFFQELFEALPDEKRRMVISEVQKRPDSTINPANLKLRTQAAPGAKVRNADNYGDGAVLVFVAMEGDVNGSNPDAGFRYLIANDPDKNYTATVLLGNKFLLEAMAREMGYHDMGSNTWSYRRLNEPRFWEMSPEDGNLNRQTFRFDWDSSRYRAVYESPFSWENGRGQYVSCKIKDGAIDLEYKRHSSSYCCYANCWRTELDPPTLRVWVAASIEAHVSRTYRLNKTSQIIEPAPVVQRSPYFLSLGLGAGYPHNSTAVSIFQPNRLRYTEHMAYLLEYSFPFCLSGVPPIDTFALHSLLFREADSVVLDDMALPGDMALFGWVGPSVNKFKVDPLHPLMGIDEHLQFGVAPAAPAQVTWTVHNILGSNENPGTISATGLYKAPSSIRGAFLRVRVMATVGNYNSSALVSVVANHLTVSPVVQTCEGGHSCTLSGRALGGGTLSWTTRNPEHQKYLVPLGEDVYRYNAPRELDDKGYFVEEIVVRNQSTGNTRSAWIMVTLANFMLAISREVSVPPLPANQTRLKVKAGTSFVPDEDVQWELLAGSGSIANGVFTAPATTDQRFALLVAGYEVFGMYFEGFILLPLPLFDYPETTTSGLKFMDV